MPDDRFLRAPKGGQAEHGIQDGKRIGGLGVTGGSNGWNGHAGQVVRLKACAGRPSGATAPDRWIPAVAVSTIMTRQLLIRTVPIFGFKLVLRKYSRETAERPAFSAQDRLVVT
jgi:hypothetical protein